MSAARDQRMVPAAAVAVLAVTLSLHPLVQGAAWFVGSAVAVAAVAGAGMGARRLARSGAVTVLVQAVALVVVLTVLFVRDRAVLGVLPGPGTAQAIADLVAEGTAVTRSQGPPVDAETGVVLLVTAGIGAVALVVDALAVTLRRPALAGLPLLAVYCVPSAILFDRTSFVWFVLAAAAFLAMLAAEGGERVRSWGRVLSGERTGAARVQLASATGARQAAVAAIALAVVAPALIPTFPLGLSQSGVLPWDGPGPGGEGRRVTTLNPILDLRRNLGERSQDEVLTYTTSVRSPGPLRVVVDEQFDGTTWSPGANDFPGENQVQEGLASPPGLDAGVRTTQERTDVEVGPLYAQTYLPMPYPARRVDVEGTWLYNSETLDVLGRDRRTDGLSYGVEHLAVQPSPEQLAAAGSPPTGVATSGTRLPPIPDLVRSEARRVAGTGTRYEQAVRLQQWFRSAGGFTYSTDAPGNGPDDGGLEVMQAFLETKRGYCVHFASTMAVMARSLGIPARVAVGFLPGELTGEDEYTVRFRDAHAWPELYFEGVGWTRFEPTPAVQSGGAPDYTVQQSGTAPTATPTATASASASPTATQAPTTQAPGAGTTQRPLLERVLDAVPWRWVGVALGVLGLLVLPAGLARLRRSWRWRSVRTRSDRAEAAWDELRSWCADLGIGWPASTTPRALRDDLAGRHELTGAARAALDRLLADLETARYAPPTGDPGRPAADLRDDVRRVADALAATRPPGVRRRARWLPATAVLGVDAPAPARDRDRSPVG